jgi:protein-L-isoaspartate(D-aspartate) O-methyltransferase
MTPGWRDLLNLIPGRPQESEGVQTPKEEPVFGDAPQDERIERMEFLLSLRRRGISSKDVLRAMDTVPREAFVLPEYSDAAYADRAMPIACGQTISQPYVVAYMSERLAVTREHRVLEVGTGSGYQAAVLSLLAGHVYSIERYRTLADHARETLARLGYEKNVTVVAGDGFNGLPEHAPYDRIMVTAAAETIPEALTAQLAEGGILLLPLGPHDGAQCIVKVTREGGATRQQELLPVRFVPLLPGQAREL